MPPAFQNVLRRMFGLDWRSLALLRIGLGAVMLADLAISGRDLRVFYTDEGVLPRSFLFLHDDPVFSLHLLGGSVGYIAFLFVLEGVFAVMLLLGWHTRFATVGCWFLAFSRQARNPLIIFGYDMILLITLFWAMFLPLNRRFSLDAAQGRAPPPAGPRYTGVPGFVFIAQFFVIYLMSAVQKTGASWTQTHDAVAYALAIEMYARPLGQWLLQYDWLMTALTYFVVYLEFYGPFLFILPVGNGWARLAGFALFTVLQAGFGLCMQMGLFWIVMIIAMFPFLPEEFWRFFAEPVARCCGLGRWLAEPPIQLSSAPKLPRFLRLLRLARDAMLLFLITLIVFWEIDDIPGHRPLVPEMLADVPKITGLAQGYRMFTPDPQSDDGWYVISGRMKNGQTVNVLTGESPVSYDEPDSVADSFGDQRWGNFLLEIWYMEYAAYRGPFADYLAREWNATHGAAEQLESLEIVFMFELIEVGHTRTEVMPITLWTKQMGAGAVPPPQ